MKNLIVIFLLAVAGCCAQPQEDFLRANSEYREGAYQKALDRYQSIQQKGRAVWYNMGNCAYHLKNYIDALVYWTRAEKHATVQEYKDIQSNQTHVYTILQRKQPQEQRILRLVTAAISWFWLQVILLILCALLYIGWCYTSGFLRILMVVMYIGLGIFAYQLCREYTMQHATYGYIAQNTVSLYSGPDVRSHERGHVDYASLVRIQEQRNTWSKIITHLGQSGWVKTASMVIV